MRLIAAAFLASLAVVSAKHNNKVPSQPQSETELETMFTSFIKEHNKQYTQEDFFNRFRVFKANVEKIRTHNLSGSSYTLGLNAHADMTWEEFRAAKLGYKSVDRSLLRSQNTDSSLDEVNASAATSVDWRAKNVVTPVKDQGQCGSCWAFSTTGSTEAAYALKTGTLVSLSEQQLVDCSTAQGNQGCNGGLMDDAFQYIISNKGLTTEASYPYKGTGPNTCAAKGKTVAATITSYKDVSKSETALLNAVALQPVSIAIEADQSAFQLYAGGVFSGTCGQNLDHGVLAVGYGTDAGKDYWIVKNSWGASWGEQGYIRIMRGKNLCGISNEASYPVA